METLDLNNSLALSGSASLRQALKKNEVAKIDTQTLQASSTQLVEQILKQPTHLIHEEVNEHLSSLHNTLESVFDVAGVSEDLQTRRFIHKTGVAISPKHALSTIRDVFRVSTFIRAVDKAIETLRERFQGQIHIVYPACGPLAPLALLLLIYYKTNEKYTSDELKFTFIDIQEGAVIALKKVLQTAGLEPFVKEVLFMDAVDYKQPPDQPIHMVLLEAMQHGFSREGQLAIAWHFSPMLEKGGLFLPEKVSIQAMLANPNEEFVEQWKDRPCEQGHQDILERFQEARVPIGTVLTVDQSLFETAKTVQLDQHTSLLECATLRIPELESEFDKKVMLFCSEVDIYAGEKIREYDSGITCPLPDLSVCINFIPNAKKEDDLYLKSGDQVKFFYRMNGIPGFFPMKVER